MKIRPAETGNTDVSAGVKAGGHGSTRTGAAGGGTCDPADHPPPLSLCPRGLQQLLHIFNFAAVVAAATAPCCIVLCAGRYNDAVLPPAEEPFTGTQPAAGTCSCRNFTSLADNVCFRKQFNSLITHSHTHSHTRFLTHSQTCFLGNKKVLCNYSTEDEHQLLLPPYSKQVQEGVFAITLHKTFFHFFVVIINSE